jgi:exonuclease III
VFSGSNVEQGAQGHRPLAFGWFTVSKLPKISQLWFVYESTKKKRFEKRPNVCKWLKICFEKRTNRVGRANCDGGNGNSNDSGNGSGDGVSGSDNNNSIDDKSGEINPFREKPNLVMQSLKMMLFSQSISFCKLGCLVCHDCHICLVCLVCLVCDVCLVCLFCHACLVSLVCTGCLVSLVSLVPLVFLVSLVSLFCLVCLICLVYLVCLVCLICLIYLGVMANLVKQSFRILVSQLTLVSQIMFFGFLFACVRQVKQLRLLIACVEYLGFLIACIKLCAALTRKLTVGVINYVVILIGSNLLYINTNYASLLSLLFVKIPCSNLKYIQFMPQCFFHLASPVLIFYLSAATMLSLTIYLTLLVQGIEHQPGPVSNKSTLSILTYNCNGLGDPKKLKRLLLKLNIFVNKGCIVFLQETHIVDTKYLEMIWKHSFLSNCIKTNSAGVIILYNKEYDLVHKFTDHEGRQLMAVIGNDERKFIVVNAYFPNEHKQGVTFAEQMYTKVLEIQSEYPDHITFCAGDLNVCLSSNDSLNRIGSQNEDLLSDVIRFNNKVAELSDAYRSVYAADGYTWKRGIIYSRLDYIFISNSVISKISGASIDWAFEASDHASVRIDFTFEEEPMRGRGIVKVNTKILEDQLLFSRLVKKSKK